jgi:hypothetical protein
MPLVVMVSLSTSCISCHFHRDKVRFFQLSRMTLCEPITISGSDEGAYNFSCEQINDSKILCRVSPISKLLIPTAQDLRDAGSSPS